MDAERLYKAVVVDDELHMREGLRLLVDWQACGFSLAGEAADAHEALALIHREAPDLAILDIRMPGMEGTQLAQRLAQSHPNLLVIFMTGYQDFEYARAAIRAHAWRYLLKPLDPDELERELRAAHAHLRQRARAGADDGDALAQSILTAMAHGRQLDTAQARAAALLGIDGDTPLQCGALRYADAAPPPEEARRGLTPPGICFAYDARTIGVVWAHALPPGADIAPPGATMALGEAFHGAARLADALRAICAPARSEAAPPEGDWQARMEAYIQAHYASAPSIAALSREIGFHKGYLGQLIKRETGLSFHQHVTRARMDQAKALLRQTDMPIADVARAVGIHDVDYFATQFKRETGRTPSAYRRK